MFTSYSKDSKIIAITIKTEEIMSVSPSRQALVLMLQVQHDIALCQRHFKDAEPDFIEGRISQIKKDLAEAMIIVTANPSLQSLSIHCDALQNACRGLQLRTEIAKSKVMESHSYPGFVGIKKLKQKQAEVLE